MLQDEMQNAAPGGAAQDLVRMGDTYRAPDHPQRQWWVLRFNSRGGKSIVTLRSDGRITSEAQAPELRQVSAEELTTTYQLVRPNPHGCVVWRAGSALVEERT